MKRRERPTVAKDNKPEAVLTLWFKVAGSYGQYSMLFLFVNLRQIQLLM